MRRIPRVLITSLAVSLCLISVFALTKPAHAAGGLTVSPPLREITLGSGLIEANTDVTIQNNTAQTVRVGLKLVDLKALGQFGGDSLDKAGLPAQYDLADWMTLPGGDSAAIAPGQTIKIEVDITNRTDLTPGGHYGAVMITANSDGKIQSNLNVSQQVVSLIFVKKLGGEKYGLDLKEMTVGQTKASLPETVKLRFASTGNVHVTPRGWVEVRDPKNKLLAKGIINPDSALLLPGTSRQLTTLLQPIANSKLPGKYKVTAYYRYDGQPDFSSQSIYFNRSASWALVIALGILSIGVLGTVIWLITRLRHRHRKTRY